MRPALARLLGLVGTLGLALASGGCSFALPVLSAGPGPDAPPEEPESTGTLAPRPAPRLAAELGPEDWRRASAALAVALDPQGNGRAVKWDNPETEMRGTIESAGPPFVRHDEVCRPFLAALAGPAAARGLPRDVRGTACRPSGGPWEIKQVGPPAAFGARGKGRPTG